MNRTPNLVMLKPATEFAETIAENMFENMDIPLSASGPIDDILEKRYAYR